MYRGRQIPGAELQQYMVMYDLSEAPAVSFTNLAPLFARIFFVDVPRQNPVSSQFQILFVKSLHCRPHLRSFISSKNASTLSYHSSKLSLEHALALWVLRCLLSLSQTIYTGSIATSQTHCHQSICLALGDHAGSLVLPSQRFPLLL